MEKAGVYQHYNDACAERNCRSVMSPTVRSLCSLSFSLFSSLSLPTPACATRLISHTTTTITRGA